MQVVLFPADTPGAGTDPGDDSPNQKGEALKWIAGVEVLEVTREAMGLAQVFVRGKAMPGPLKGDAIHVASAAVHGVEYMLSWNVRHLANPNKAAHMALLCLRAGVLVPRIVTPDLLWETSDERA